MPQVRLMQLFPPATIDNRLVPLLSKINLEPCEISHQQRERLDNLIEVFSDCLSAHKYDLGECTAGDVHIRTTSDAPIYSRPARVPVKYQDELNTHLQALLEAGIIIESSTPWCAPIVMVAKKDGSLRPCLDFRKLNQVTVPDNFPMPRIDTVLEKIGGHKFYFSTGLSSEYMQLRLGSESSHKYGLITEDRIFRMTRLPFGLKSAPSYFARCLALGLSGLSDNVLAYVDDILIFTDTFEQHLDSLRKVFERFRHFNLNANRRKCDSLRKEITFLGHRITGERFSPAEHNVKDIRNFLVPKTIPELSRYQPTH